jgi:hypothetical protein
VNEQETLWRQQYRTNRYLEFETPAGLWTRARDITANAYTIDQNGKYHVVFEATHWHEMLSHIFEELGFRNIELPPPQLPHYSKAIKGAELWETVDLSRGDYLLKFGKLEYMNDFYANGRLRISSAESYADVRYNAARYDTECEFTQESIGATIQFPPGGDYSIPQEQWISDSVIGTLKRKSTYGGRAYIACFSMKYENRLFEDFDADACVVIREPLGFMKAVKEWGEAHLPNWFFYIDHVAYRDPFKPIKEVDVLYTKHFKYSYQREFRMSWEQDKNGHPPPEPKFMELGPLTDYCDLLVLEPD